MQFRILTLAVGLAISTSVHAYRGEQGRRFLERRNINPSFSADSKTAGSEVRKDDASHPVHPGRTLQRQNAFRERIPDPPQDSARPHYELVPDHHVPNHQNWWRSYKTKAPTGSLISERYGKDPSKTNHDGNSAARHDKNTFADFWKWGRKFHKHKDVKTEAASHGHGPFSNDHNDVEFPFPEQDQLSSHSSQEIQAYWPENTERRFMPTPRERQWSQSSQQ